MVDLRSLEELAERKHGKEKTKAFSEKISETFSIDCALTLGVIPDVSFGYHHKKPNVENMVPSPTPGIRFYRRCSADIAMITQESPCPSTYSM